MLENIVEIKNIFSSNVRIKTKEWNSQKFKKESNKYKSRNNLHTK